MKLLAILTPSYNRADLLKKLYKSLCEQTSKNFKWYIINDGSLDNTKEIVSSFCENDFEIEYHEKINGGKHTAINYAMQYIEEELTFIVDNDDFLTNDAVETIQKDWDIYKEQDRFCGLSYYKMTPQGTIVGNSYKNNEILIDTFINVRINQRVSGDKAEVWKTKILNTHPFPVYEGEKFMSEAVVWNWISRDGYKMAFIPKGIYYCEYHNDGLTKAGRKLRLLTPFGTMEHAYSYICKEVNFKTRLKYIIYYIAVSVFSKNRRYAFKKIGKKYKFLFSLMYIPSSLLGHYWRIKYC